MRCPNFSCDRQLLKSVVLISAVIVNYYSALSWLQLRSSTITVRRPDFSFDRHVSQCVFLIWAVIVNYKSALSWLQLRSSSITVRCPDFSCDHRVRCVVLTSAVIINCSASSMIIIDYSTLSWFQLWSSSMAVRWSDFSSVCRYVLQCIVLISACLSSFTALRCPEFHPCSSSNTVRSPDFSRVYRHLLRHHGISSHLCVATDAPKDAATVDASSHVLLWHHAPGPDRQPFLSGHGHAGLGNLRGHRDLVGCTRCAKVLGLDVIDLKGMGVR